MSNHIHIVAIQHEQDSLAKDIGKLTFAKLLMFNLFFLSFRMSFWYIKVLLFHVL